MKSHILNIYIAMLYSVLFDSCGVTLYKYFCTWTVYFSVYLVSCGVNVTDLLQKPHCFVPKLFPWGFKPNYIKWKCRGDMKLSMCSYVFYACTLYFICIVKRVKLLSHIWTFIHLDINTVLWNNPSKHVDYILDNFWEKIIIYNMK